MGDDDNNCIKHYKKRLIYQHYPPKSPKNHEATIYPVLNLEGSNNNDNDESQQKIVLKKTKRKNCRGQFRHENLELIKLGTSNNQNNRNGTVQTRIINNMDHQNYQRLSVGELPSSVNVVPTTSPINLTTNKSAICEKKPPEVITSNRVPVICNNFNNISNEQKNEQVVDLTKKAHSDDIAKMPKLYLIKDLLASGVKILNSNSSINYDAKPKIPYFYERFTEPLTKKQEEDLNAKFFTSSPSSTAMRMSDSSNSNLANLQMMANAKLRTNNSNFATIASDDYDDFKVAKVINVKLHHHHHQHHHHHHHQSNSNNLNPLVNNNAMRRRRLSIETTTSSTNSSRSSSCERIASPPSSSTSSNNNSTMIISKSNHDNNAQSNNKVPKGKLSYYKMENCFIRYFDQAQKQLFLNNLNHNGNDDDTGNNYKDFDKLLQEKIIGLPPDVKFNDKDELNVEEYVVEMTMVEKFVPNDFFHFYKFVTGYQICNNKPPVSFLTFLKIYNTNGLTKLLDRYIQSLNSKRC